MTPSINDINKEPDSNITPSLPTNKFNTRSTSLASNTSNTRSLNTTRSRSIPLSSNKSNTRSFNNDNKDNSLINERNSRRRGGTYDLDWYNFQSADDDYIDPFTRDIAQDVSSTLPDSTIMSPTSSIPSPYLPPTSPLTSPITTEINNDNSDNEGQFPNFFGGITVTTVKVVHVDECLPEESSKIPLPKNKGNNNFIPKKQQTNLISTNQQKTKQNNNNNITQTIKERRKTRIYNIKQDDITTTTTTINNNIVRRTSSKRRKLVRSGVTIYRKKSYKKSQRQQEERVVIATATTSNPCNTNDPTDMEGDDDSIQTPVMKWMPVTNGPPKLLHASLIPLSQINKKVTSSTTVQRSKSKRKSAVGSIPRRPSQLFRQNLLEQSVAMSLDETIMGRNVFAFQPIRNQPKRKSVVSIKRLKRKSSVESILAPRPKRPSQLFRQNLLEQSVAMSLNEAIMGRNVFVSQPIHKQPKRKSVESILAPKPKRSSQIFRQNLLEQSVAMSLNEAIMGKNVFSTLSTRRQSFLNVNVSASKVPRRRFSRKGSNAKFNKLRISIKKGKAKNNDIQEEQQKPVNAMAMPRILETDELKKKVEEQLRRKEQSPQPPPRSFTQPAVLQREVVLRRQRSRSLLNTRSVSSPVSSSSYREFDVESITFPTHLSRINNWF